MKYFFVLLSLFLFSCASSYKSQSVKIFSHTDIYVHSDFSSGAMEFFTRTENKLYANPSLPISKYTIGGIKVDYSKVIASGTQNPVTTLCELREGKLFIEVSISTKFWSIIPETSVSKSNSCAAQSNYPFINDPGDCENETNMYIQRSQIVFNELDQCVENVDNLSIFKKELT